MILFSIFEPIFQYRNIVEIQDKDSMLFVYSNDNTERISFSYNDKEINTIEQEYFLIGTTMNYYFVRLEFWKISRNNVRFYDVF